MTSAGHLARIITPTAPVVVGLLSTSLFLACRTTRDANSGPDKDRIYATPVDLNAIIDDALNGPEGDSTDWKSVEVQELSELRFGLHWDDANAQLTLSVHDALGQQLSRGEPAGARGLEAVVPKANPGRYYAQVSAVNDDTATTYSLKTLVAKAQPERCHNCTPGQTICLGMDGYALCEPTPEGCNAWVKTFSCKPSERCRDGVCAAGCSNQCTEETRRCASDKSFQVCQRTDDGCLMWSSPTACAAGDTCTKGACRRATTPPRPTPAPSASADGPSRSASIRGRIISMVKQGNRMMLHIEIGDDNPVKVGAQGWVLSGSSSERLKGGEFKVTQVTGKYCIATTDLKALGKNRSVELETK